MGDGTSDGAQADTATGYFLHRSSSRTWTVTPDGVRSRRYCGHRRRSGGDVDADGPVTRDVVGVDQLRWGAVIGARDASYKGIGASEIGIGQRRGGAGVDGRMRSFIAAHAFTGSGRGGAAAVEDTLVFSWRIALGAEHIRHRRRRRMSGCGSALRRCRGW